MLTSSSCDATRLASALLAAAAYRDAVEHAEPPRQATSTTGRGGRRGGQDR